MTPFKCRALSLVAILLAVVSASLLAGCALPHQPGLTAGGQYDRDGGGGN